MGEVALTGAGGFLGWHTRAALRAQGHEFRAVALGDHFDRAAALEGLNGTSRVIHLAGVNRADDRVIREGNVSFAEQLAGALRSAEHPPQIVVYANSTQAGNGSVYGEAKAKAAEILAAAAAHIGADFLDVSLPNLFGEHGRPFYNSVTATFCHLLASGEDAHVDTDRTLTLLHAQNAADVLIGAIPPSAQADHETHVDVSSLLAHLRVQASTYRNGEIPDISTAFLRDLFNTYRSFAFQSHTPVRLTRNADARGSFFEVIRSHGGTGQSSFSTTVPGVTRGDHFHRRKFERFTVLSGRAKIALRRLFTDDVYLYDVDGESPMAVDMPTMWAHNIVNEGADILFTSFWTNDIFDPADPDTIAELV